MAKMDEFASNKRISDLTDNAQQVEYIVGYITDPEAEQLLLGAVKQIRQAVELVKAH